MGLNDAFDKAKDAASDNKDKIGEGIDAASEKAQDAAPDQFDGAIGDGADKAKDGLGNL
ncbi:antitoxin [Brachybacterium sp. MASK1Z-5]|uniref:Antitoxin n=1 Tax=Brachybacterium halotolerans TaxID=2795215 RepID=A0ABS1B9X3_9MICO|nr:Rv0909 family putative TA system antitoxin [Brachybacterium halotolerans]MBK0331297.1 antitoxin [Brachybacterium halotolerans]